MMHAPTVYNPMDPPHKVISVSPRTDSHPPNRTDTIESDILCIEGCIYEDLPSAISSFRYRRTKHNDIASWLRMAGPPSSPGRGQLTAGIRLVCLQNRDPDRLDTIEELMEYPLEENTLRATNDAIGINPDHEYLTKCRAGSCGRYFGIPQQPGILPSARMRTADF